MSTFEVVDAISRLPLLDHVGVVDFSDKLSFIATCVLLIACSLIVTLREYVMDPISCYMSHSPGGENVLKFVENYCWVQGTMSINDHRIPDNDNDWKVFEKTRIVYYQWVPFMLLFQAALFHVPRILWSIFTFNMTGTNVHEIVTMAASTKLKDFDVDIERLAMRIQYMLVEHREYRGGYLQRFKRNVYKYLPLCVVSKRFANWLTFGYMCTKILYLVNSVGQIYLMQTFLHLHDVKEYSSNFGLEIARNIIGGRNWEVTDVFPRMTYCMVRVKHMASVNTITAQCVLTANLFIEKIYIFLWFWIVIVAIFTAYSFLLWVIRFLVPSMYCQEVRKYLTLRGHPIDNDDHIEGFCKEFLRLDGMFLLQMIRINAGDLVAAPLVNRLFVIYLDRYKGKKFTVRDTFSRPRSDYELENLKSQSLDFPSV